MNDNEEKVKGSAALDRVRTLLAEVMSAWADRPDDALLLMKEAHAVFKSMPAEERKLLNKTFDRMLAEMDKQEPPN